MRSVNIPTMSVLIVMSLGSCNNENKFGPEQKDMFRQAAERSVLVNEGYNRC